MARRLLVDEGLVVVGEAADGAGAVAVVAELKPEVVLVDVGLPDFDGFEVARRLHRSGAAVILISTRQRSEWRRRLAAAPVCGYLGKEELSAESILRLMAAAR